jgi:chromate transporter
VGACGRLTKGFSAVKNNREIKEVAKLFLKLGFTAFGGPAAHVSIMHNEVVIKRKWLSEQHFLDLIGATNLIPGPNSTEMAIHIECDKYATKMIGPAFFINNLYS